MGRPGLGGGEKAPEGDGIGEPSLVTGDSDSMTGEGEGKEEVEVEEDGEVCSMTGAVASAVRGAVSKTGDALVRTAWGLVKLLDAWLGPYCSNRHGRDQKSCSSSICP